MLRVSRESSNDRCLKMSYDVEVLTNVNGLVCESPWDDIVATRAWTTDRVKDLRVLPCRHEEGLERWSAAALVLWFLSTCSQCMTPVAMSGATRFRVCWKVLDLFDSAAAFDGGDVINTGRRWPRRGVRRCLLESAITFAQTSPALRGVTVAPTQEKFHACLF